MIAERGYDVVEDAGRGYRRVVASPKPAGIVELDTIRSLVETNHVVIACGGGGIPVFRTEGNHLKGAAAVIDKDFAAARLAEQLDADFLVILTAVEKVAVNFGKPDQQWLDELTRPPRATSRRASSRRARCCPRSRPRSRSRSPARAALR